MIIDKWYIEKASGKNMERLQLQAMLEYAREGDIIYIHDLSRIASSTKDLLTLVERLQQNGIELVSGKDAIDTSTPIGKFFLTVTAALNQLECENMKERQREGIEEAKKKENTKGENPNAWAQIGKRRHRFMRTVFGGRRQRRKLQKSTICPVRRLTDC